MPAICRKPPGPTVAGAGLCVRAFVTPRGLTTGPDGAGACARAAAPAHTRSKITPNCRIALLTPESDASSELVVQCATVKYERRPMTSPPASPSKAVCLLSGGLDSSTCLALARREGYECYALSFDYGQRHRVELEAAARVAAALGAARHLVARIDLTVFGGSALTAGIPVPKGRQAQEIGQGIPVTYVPARNTIFLSFALAWAEVLETSHIFIGVNALDYSGYPDCRPEYIQAFERMADMATQAGVEGRTHIQIHTPLLHLSKAEIVRLGRDLGLDFSLTHSCYDPAPEGRPCGLCDACLLRRKGFEEAGIEDR